MIGYYIPTYLCRVIGVSEKVVAASYTFLYVGQVLSIMVGGYFSDTRGGRWTISVGSLTCFAITLLIPLFSSHALVAVSLVTLFGITSGLYGMGLNVVVTEIIETKSLARVYGMLDAIDSLIYIAGPLLGGMVFAQAAEMLFYIASLIFLICFILSLIIKLKY